MDPERHTQSMCRTGPIKDREREREKFIEQQTSKENLTVFQRGQSGWRFRSIVSLNVFTVEYKPLKGSSYISLPSCLASKKAIINMQNEDDQCFKWSITRALNSKEIPALEELRQLAKECGLKRYSELNKAKLLEQLEIKVVLNPQRIDKKLQEQAKELNWNGINFPASWKDIDKFEKNNPTIDGERVWNRNLLSEN